MVSYQEVSSKDTHLAIVKGDWSPEDDVHVRVHSSSETGEMISSIFLERDNRLSNSLEIINKQGKGVLLIMRQGERGDDIEQRLQEFEETKDLKTLTKVRSQVNKDFGVGAQILNDLGVRKINLISNSTSRKLGHIGYGLELMKISPIS
jgi:3,4-dihydroxy 2-butanone 4-phosphate synthase/GTP cyclohydrolase II